MGFRIPPGPQKGLPSSAVVIGDTYDNKFVDHMRDTGSDDGFNSSFHLIFTPLGIFY